MFLSPLVRINDAKRYGMIASSRSMRPKDWVVVAVMAMMCMVPLTSLPFDFLEDDLIIAQGPGGHGNQNPPLVIPASQTLAFDSAFAFGSSRGYEGVSDIISHNGFTYVSGAYSGDINLGMGCSASSTNLQSGGGGEEALTNGLPFVAKFDSNGTCIWIAPVTFTEATSALNPHRITDDSHKLAMDSNGNLYLVSSFTSYYAANVNFGSLTLDRGGLLHNAFLAKINPNGSFDMVNHLKQTNKHLYNINLQSL